MKNLLPLAFLLFCLSVSGQDKFTLNIAGIKPEIESQMYENDVIMSWTGYNNVTIRARNKGKDGWALSGSTIYKVDFNPASKHYNMSIKYDIKASEWLDINKPMIIRVIAHTSFGNDIWWEQECTRSISDKQILLDKYTAEESFTDRPARKGIYVHIKGFTDEVKGKLAQIPGDKIASQNNIIFWARNEGQPDWPVQKTITWYFSSTGNFNHAFGTGDTIDFNKKIEIRFAVLTTFGNYYWGEVANTSDKIYLPFDISQLTGELFKPGTPLKTTIAKTEVPAETKVASTGAATASTALKGFVDFKVQQGKLKIANIPDSVVYGNLKSTLLEDGVIQIGSITNSQSIRLKGGQPINYNPGEGYVIQATGNGEQKYRTKNGDILLKDNAPIEFSKFYISAALLASDAMLTINGSEVPAKASGNKDGYDLRFDEEGQLMEATLSKAMSYTIGGQVFAINAGSRLIFRNGHFIEIALNENLSLTLNNVTYQVMGTQAKESSLFFNVKSGDIEKMILTGENSVDIENTKVPVKNGSWMSLTKTAGGYVVDQFHVGKETVLKVYGNKNAKETKVKEGKRVTVTDGKITKVSLL